jgi:hypothetical protein
MWESRTPQVRCLSRVLPYHHRLCRSRSLTHYPPSARLLACSSDYIEIHNYGPLWIDMTGFRISDRCEFEGAYVFPDGVNIGPDERAVLLADGSDRQSQGLNYLDFRLSSSGETVCLFAPDGTLLSRMAIPALGPDQAYGLVSGAEPSSGDYQLMERPTPGIPNSGAAAPTPFDVEVVHLGAVPAGQSFRCAPSECCDLSRSR